MLFVRLYLFGNQDIVLRKVLRFALITEKRFLQVARGTSAFCRGAVVCILH